MKAQRLLVMPALVILGAPFAACGSGGSSSGGGLADQSAAQIADAASNAVKTATSFHMKGSVQSSAQSLTMDVTVKVPHALKGTLEAGGKGSFQLVTTDNQSFDLTPDDQFWTSYAGAPAAALLSGKCIIAGSSSNGFGQLTSGVSKLTNVSQLFASTNTSTLKKGSTLTVNGQQAIALTDPKGNEIDIATSGQPLPLQVKGADGSDITFDHWNADVTIDAPPGCVDLSQLQQQLGAAPTPTP